MKSRRFDVIIIGGGITGAGIARDAALRGLSVALVERNDYASGTSSKSARMIHGGFRYLEQFQLGLVYSACTERHILRKIAARLVKPSLFVFPVYKYSKNSLMIVNLGMWLYEFLALFRNLKRHRVVSSQAVCDKEPALSQEQLRGAVYYYDCLADDARFTLETIKAAHQSGATIANYAEVVSLIKENGKAVGIEVMDRISNQSFAIYGKVIVNAAGIWVDTIQQMDDFKLPKMLRANRGSHVVVPREKVPIHDVVIFMSADDQRGMYAVPWENTVIVGTTDLDHFEDLDNVYATQEEVFSMLDSINKAFPGADLNQDDVISTFAGLRPLIGGQEENAYQASRDHEIFDRPSGLVSIAGGKFTTHRKMAEDMVNHIIKRLREMEQISISPKASTSRTPIEEKPFDVQAELRKFIKQYLDFDREVLTYLLETYGSEAVEIIQITEKEPTLRRPIVIERPYIYAEIPHAVRSEMTMTLCDFLIRRTHIIHETRGQGLTAAREVAECMAKYIGWEPDEIERQISAYQKQVSLTKAFLN